MSNSLDNQEIKSILPHRWPFLLVDKVTKVSKQQIEGIKNVSSADICFLGHFPEVSIFPGVLIIECLAQLSGLYIAQSSKEDEGVDEFNDKIGFLTSVRSFKFIKTIKPGDQIILKSVLKGKSKDCYIFSVFATVDKEQMACGEIQLFLQSKEVI